jgi:hypothetical protein
MAYVQLCCSSIGALLRSSDNGAWISSAINFFEVFNLPQTYGRFWAKQFNIFP